MISLPSVFTRVAVCAARVRRTQERFASLAMIDMHRSPVPVAGIFRCRAANPRGASQRRGIAHGA